MCNGCITATSPMLVLPDDVGPLQVLCVVLLDHHIRLCLLQVRSNHLYCHQSALLLSKQCNRHSQCPSWYFCYTTVKICRGPAKAYFLAGYRLKLILLFRGNDYDDFLSRVALLDGVHAIFPTFQFRRPENDDHAHPTFLGFSCAIDSVLLLAF